MIAKHLWMSSQSKQDGALPHLTEQWEYENDVCAPLIWISHNRESISITPKCLKPEASWLHEQHAKCLLFITKTVTKCSLSDWNWTDFRLCPLPVSVSWLSVTGGRFQLYFWQTSVISGIMACALSCPNWRTSPESTGSSAGTKPLQR